jgi:hypothetical protein
MAELDFADEIAAFLRELPGLREKHSAEWAVFSGGQLRGAFADFGEALDFVDENYPDERALIRSLYAEEPQVPLLSVA